MFERLAFPRTARMRSRKKERRSRSGRRSILEHLEDRRLLAFDPAAYGVVSAEWFAVPELDDTSIDASQMFQTAGPISPASLDAHVERGVEEAIRQEWIVRLTPEALVDISTPADVQSLLDAAASDSFDLRVERGLGLPGLIQVSTETDDVRAAEEFFAKSPKLAYFDENLSVQLDATTPDDPKFTDLWGLHNTGQTGGTADADIDAPEAWGVRTGSGNVVIGVIDTGVDYTHIDLATNMWVNPGEVPGDNLDNDGNGFADDVYGWDFINNDSDPFDDHAHGTHVSGTIAGVGDNDTGVVGVNWNAKIMALKFLGASGGGNIADAVAAQNYATMMKRDHGVNVVATSNSWGGGGFSQAMFDAIEASRDENMLFIAAAGNSSRNNDVIPHYPSNYNLDNVISVAATTHTDARASFSNFGASSVHLGAPGESILSTTPGNTYSTFNGTSMATPHVSGVAALAWDLAPAATYDVIRDAIFDGVDVISSMSTLR